ncbi:hypothetical protein SCALM49S_07910 [Streptomyces californicus]
MIRAKGQDLLELHGHAVLGALTVLRAAHRRAAPVTACSPRTRSSPTSRSTAHIEAVQPSASRTGSPVMCRVRVWPSARTMRNSPSIARPSTRQPVTMAVSSGWSSGSRTDGRSSRDRGADPGGLPKISYNSSDQAHSSVRRFHSALPTPYDGAPRPGASGAGPSSASRPSVSCPVSPDPQPAQVLVQTVQVLHGQLVQGALPAPTGVVLVEQEGVAPYGVDIAAQPPCALDQGVDGVTRGRSWCGAVREEGGRHLVLRYRRGLAGSDRWAGTDFGTARDGP